MISLICFHDLAVEIQVSALLVVVVMVACLLTLRGFWRFGLDSHRIEFLWTIIPFAIIIAFAAPSLTSLYLLASFPTSADSKPELETLKADALRVADCIAEFYVKHGLGGTYFYDFSRDTEPNRSTVLVTGRQWYWDYGVSSKVGKLNLSRRISSHMLNTSDVFHLLRLDQWLFLYPRESYAFSVTSGDVLHSFAIPTLGIKIDAVPGKDNTVYCAPLIPGLYFGNCSEICGVNHSVIPIGVVVDGAKCEPIVEKFSFFFAAFNYFINVIFGFSKCTKISLIVNRALCLRHLVLVD